MWIQSSNPSALISEKNTHKIVNTFHKFIVISTLHWAETFTGWFNVYLDWKKVSVHTTEAILSVFYTNVVNVNFTLFKSFMTFNIDHADSTNFSGCLLMLNTFYNKQSVTPRNLSKSSVHINVKRYSFSQWVVESLNNFKTYFPGNKMIGLI